MMCLHTFSSRQQLQDILAVATSHPALDPIHKQT